MKTFRLQDADKFVAALSLVMQESAKKGLLAAAAKTVQHIQTQTIPSTRPAPPEDKGLYKAGWKSETHEHGAIVYNDVPYAAVLEDGAKAGNIKIGTKMIQMLAEWVRRKGVGSSTVTNKSGQTRVVKASKTEATRIAWAIAKSMQVRGILGGVGLKIFERASKKIPEFIEEEVTRELKKVGQ